MKKILFGIDAVNIDQNAMEFAINLAQLTNSRITGVFLENLISNEKAVLKTFHGTPYLDWKLDTGSVEYRQKMKTIGNSIASFKLACEKEKVNYVIHEDRGVPGKEMLEESWFADLVVVSRFTNFSEDPGVPTRFIQRVLKHANCPVIVAPVLFDSVEEIVFAYNGTKSSFFAMKQFTYLFPEYRNKKVHILSVHSKKGNELENKKYLEEWVYDHYTSYEFEDLKGDTEDKLFNYLYPLTNRFIVMGAYERGSLSYLLNPSLADLIMNTNTHPIFISHC